MPERVKVPLPDLFKAPVPEITPAKVWLDDESTVKVPELAIAPS